MSINPIGSAGIFNITNNVTNNMKNKGASTASPLSPEAAQDALENLKNTLRGRVRNSFDTVEISDTISEDRREKLFAEESMNILGFARLRTDNDKYCTTFTNEQVSDRAKALSWLMDGNRPVIFIPTDSKGDVGEAQLAQHLGDIGKRIDACFAAGEITQQEYDDLNAGLEKYTEAAAASVEWLAAARAVGRTYTQTMNAMVKGGAPQQEIEAFAKAYQKTREDMINEFIKRSRKINRSLLVQMVQQVREGKDLVQPEDRWSSLEKKNLAGILESGPAPLAPEESE